MQPRDCGSEAGWGPRNDKHLRAERPCLCASACKIITGERNQPSRSNIKKKIWSCAFNVVIPFPRLPRGSHAGVKRRRQHPKHYWSRPPCIRRKHQDADVHRYTLLQIDGLPIKKKSKNRIGSRKKYKQNCARYMHFYTDRKICSVWPRGCRKYILYAI